MARSQTLADKSSKRYLVKGKGVKYLAKTFTLPDVQVGSIIEYSYTIDLGEYMLFDSHWILSDELFTKKAQFSLKPYLAPTNPLSLRWSWLGPARRRPFPSKGRTTSYGWKRTIYRRSSWKTTCLLPMN